MIIGALLSTAQDWSGLVERLIILILLHSAATLYNDIQDMDVDKLNHRGGALHNNALTLQDAKRVVIGLVLAVLIIALARPNASLQLGLVGITLALSLLYDSSRFRFSRRPILSLVVLGLVYGALPLFSGFVVVGGQVSLAILLISAIWFTQRASISMLKDYKDAVGDKAIGKDTYYLHFGPKVTAITSFAMAVVAYVGAILWLYQNHKPNSVLMMTIVVLAVIAMSNRLRLLKTKNEPKLNIIFHASIMWQNIFEVGVATCLILSSK